MNKITADSLLVFSTILKQVKSRFTKDLREMQATCRQTISKIKTCYLENSNLLKLLPYALGGLIVFTAAWVISKLFPPILIPVVLGFGFYLYYQRKLNQELDDFLISTLPSSP